MSSKSDEITESELLAAIREAFERGGEDGLTLSEIITMAGDDPNVPSRRRRYGDAMRRAISEGKFTCGMGQRRNVVGWRNSVPVYRKAEQ